MKKLIAILVAVLMLTAMPVAASAATTTLTTTVPGATYTMNIPADQEIPYGATSTNIGTVTITDAQGFALGKNVYVSVVFDGLFKSETSNSTIPYTVEVSGYNPEASVGYEHRTEKIASGDFLSFWGTANGTVNSYHSLVGYRDQKINVNVLSTNWGKALGGEYKTTITFTAQVANEEPTA